MSAACCDAHKSTLTFAHLSPAGEQLVAENQLIGKEHMVKETIPTRFDSFRDFVARYPGPVVLYVETSREGPRVCSWARRLGVEVHLIDARKLKPIAKALGPKNDKRDARMMALLTLSRALIAELEVYLAPPEVADDRALTRGRQVLRKISTLLRNVLRVVLHLNDVQVEVTDLHGKLAQESWEGWLEELPPKARIVASILVTLMNQVEEALAGLDALIAEEAKADPVIRELQKIPGVGKITAYGILAEIGDIDRFQGPDRLISCAGLAPMCKDSGSFRGKRQLPSRCNKRLRHLLVQAAQCAANCSTPNRMRETYRRVKQKWDPTTASIAAARELATEVFYTLKRLKAAQAQEQDNA